MLGGQDFRFSQQVGAIGFRVGRCGRRNVACVKVPGDALATAPHGLRLRANDRPDIGGKGIYELYRQMAAEQTAREFALIAAPDPRQQRQDAILAERSRFAALMEDRPATLEESAAHTEAIDAILCGRHAYA